MVYSEQVVAVISECVVKVVKQMLSEYNMLFNRKLKNIVITADNIKPLSITGESIGTGAILGKNIAAGTITNVNIQDGSIETAKIHNLTAEIMNAVVANIASADIDWASIKDLEATTAKIAKATIEKADIDWAKITDLNTTIQNTSYAVIRDAKISFAQIYDAALEKAIITQGVANKFYIKDLVVTDANMGAVTVGKLIVQDDEGNFYQVIVDENGVSSELVQIESGNIAQNAVTNDNIASGAITGDKIGSGTITGSNIQDEAIGIGNLNVGAIFGDEALVTKITATMGQFGTLFANEAIVNQLETHLINSDYLKIFVHDTLKLGGRNLVRRSNVPYSNSNFVVATYDFGDSPPVNGEEITIRIKGELGAGKTFFNILNTSESVNIGNLKSNDDGTYSETFTWHTDYIGEDELVYEVDNSHLIVRALEESTSATTVIEWIMVERGNHMSDWSAAPEDVDEDIETLITQVNAVEQRILPDKIITTVTQSDEYRNGMNIVQQSAVEQTKNELEIRFQNTETAANQAQASADAIKNDLDTWYHFDEEALTIGKSDSKYKTRQDNEKYEFLYEDAVTASISGSEMVIPRANITDELKIGGMKILVDQTNGAMEWVWVGMDEEVSAVWHN